MPEITPYKILFFGSVAEQIGKKEVVLNEHFQIGSDAVLYFKELFPEIQSLNFRVAFDMEMMDSFPNRPFREVALLPPFAGG